MKTGLTRQGKMAFLAIGKGILDFTAFKMRSITFQMRFGDL
jgi:hypothetical protein